MSKMQNAYKASGLSAKLAKLVVSAMMEFRDKFASGEAKWCHGSGKPWPIRSYPRHPSSH